MRKLVSLVLAVCMCLSVSIMLTACGHDHTYEAVWSKDATHHWHACEGDDCTEVSDKGEHTWNDGEITTPATEEADGTKTFTCTVCAQTKTESVQLDRTVTEAEWIAAFTPENYMKDGMLNLTVTMETSWDGEITVLFADGKMKNGDEIQNGWDFDRFDSSDYSIFDFVNAYDIFEYDAETGAYLASDGSDENIEIVFLDNKFVSCKISLGTGEDAEIWTTYYTKVGETVIP